MKKAYSMKNLTNTTTTILFNTGFDMFKGNFVYIIGGKSDLVNAMFSMRTNRMIFKNFKTFYTKDNMVVQFNSKARGKFIKQSKMLGELLDEHGIEYDHVPKTYVQRRGFNAVHCDLNVYDTIAPELSTNRGNVLKMWNYISQLEQFKNNGDIYFCTNGLKDKDILSVGSNEDYGNTNPLMSFVYMTKYYAQVIVKMFKGKSIYISGPRGTFLIHVDSIEPNDVKSLFQQVRVLLKKIHQENAEPNTNAVIMASLLDGMDKDGIASVVDNDAEDVINAEGDVVVDEEKELDDFIEKAREEGAKSFDIKSKYIKSPLVKGYVAKSRAKFSKQNENVMKEYSEIDDSIPKSVYKIDTVTDMNENSFENFTQTYEDTLKDKDMFEIGAAYADAEIPLYLVDMKKVRISDRLNKVDKYVYTFKDGAGKQSTVALEMPIVYNGNRMKLNGSEKTIEGQLTYHPIIKIEDVVWITANYNKMFVEYKGGNNLSPRISRTTKGLKKATENKDLSEFIGIGNYSSLWKGRTPTVTLREMSKQFGTITNADKDKLGARNVDEIIADKMIKNKEFYVTFNPSLITEDNIPKSDYVIGVVDDEVISVNIETDTISIGETELNNIEELFEAISTYTGLTIFEYIEDISLIGKIKGTYCKVFGKDIPMVYILMYREGLLTFLDRYSIPYRVVMKEEGKKTKPRFDKFREVRLNFEDAYLIIDSEEKVEVMTLLSPLLNINGYTENIPFSGINNLGYLSMIIEEYASSARVPTDMRNIYTTFIDTSTKDILRRLDLPTDFSDVLMYANVLLSSSESHDMNDLDIYRYRTSEQIVGIASKVMADAYSDYANKTRNRHNAKISVSPKSVVVATMQLPNVSEYSKLNPTNQVDKRSTCSYKGHMGKNLSRAYTLDARKYHDSHVGRISVVSAYSAPIGIGKHLSIDPAITDARGFFKDKSLDELTYKEIASASEGVTPFATNHDDPARLCMNMSQKNHIIGINGAEPAYVSTGFDKLLPHLATDFVFKAKGSGTITEKNNYQMTITYDNGEVEVIPMDELNRNPSKGSYMKNDMYSKYSVGSKVAKDTIVAYNPQMFKEVPGMGVTACIGTVANVGFMALPETYEDAVMISASLSKKLSKSSVKRIAVKFDKNTTSIDNFISIMADEGKLVLSDDVILTYRKQTDDDIIDKFLSEGAASELNETKKKAKVTGELRDIRIHYNGDISEAHPTIQKMVTKVNGIYKKRSGSSLSKASLDNQLDVDKTPYQVSEGTKINGEKIEKDQILIEFFIEYNYKAGVGDKLTVYTALKGIICKVLPDDQMPHGVDTGRRVDYCMSHLSPMARKTFSVLFAAAIGRTMEWLKEEVSK